MREIVRTVIEDKISNRNSNDKDKNSVRNRDENVRFGDSATDTFIHSLFPHHYHKRETINNFKSNSITTFAFFDNKIE